MNDSEFDLGGLASIHDLVRNQVWTGRGICGAVEARRALEQYLGRPLDTDTMLAVKSPADITALLQPLE